MMRWMRRGKLALCRMRLLDDGGDNDGVNDASSMLVHLWLGRYTFIRTVVDLRTLVTERPHVCPPEQSI